MRCIRVSKSRQLQLFTNNQIHEVLASQVNEILQRQHNTDENEKKIVL